MKIRIAEIMWIAVILVLLLTFVFGYKMTLQIYKPIDVTETQQKVLFESVTEELNRNFEQSVTDKEEYVLCMYGEVTDDGYVINEVARPNIETATMEYVIFSQCETKIGKQFVGLIHSHVGEEGGTSCQQSLTDIYTFGFMSARIGSVINCVQCGKSTFGCYTPDSLWQRLYY